MRWLDLYAAEFSAVMPIGHVDTETNHVFDGAITLCGGVEKAAAESDAHRAGATRWPGRRGAERGECHAGRELSYTR